MEFLTTQQTAERLGVSLRRVQAMVKAGRLPASRFGRALVIKEEDLVLVSDRKTGRPPKVKAEDEQSCVVEAKSSVKATKKSASKPAKQARKKGVQ